MGTNTSIFYILCTKGIIVNLYKLHFHPSIFLSNQTKKLFTLPLFHPSIQTHPKSHMANKSYKKENRIWNNLHYLLKKISLKLFVFQWFTFCLFLFSKISKTAYGSIFSIYNTRANYKINYYSIKMLKY